MNDSFAELQTFEPGRLQVSSPHRQAILTNEEDNLPPIEIDKAIIQTFN
jgi:hypothetical protein